jgi:hypothetical protein
MKTDFVVGTAGLTRRYGRDVLAVDNLHLREQRGEVDGFVGPPAWAPNPHACFATSAAKSRRNAAAYRPAPAERHGAGSPPTGPPALSTPNEPAEPGG